MRTAHSLTVSRSICQGACPLPCMSPCHTCPPPPRMPSAMHSTPALHSTPAMHTPLPHIPPCHAHPPPHIAPCVVGACGGMCGRGWAWQGWRAWQGACVAAGHAWQGVCPLADTMRYSQWAGGMHPTGMHSCYFWWHCMFKKKINIHMPPRHTHPVIHAPLAMHAPTTHAPHHTCPPATHAPPPIHTPPMDRILDTRFWKYYPNFVAGGNYL